MCFIYFVSVNEYFIPKRDSGGINLWSARKVEDRRNTARLLAQAIYVLPCALSQTVLSGKLYLMIWMTWKLIYEKMQSDSFMCSFIWQFIWPLIECQLYPPKSKGLCITERVQVRGDCSQTLTHLEFIVLEVNHGSTQHILYGRLLGLGTTTISVRTDSKVCAGLGLRGRMKTWESSLEKLGRVRL